MIIFLTILVSVFSVFFGFLSVRFFINRIEERQTRTILVTVTGLMTAVVILVAVGVAFVPKPASNAIRGVIEFAGNTLESASPGIGDEVLDADGFREVVSRGKSLRGTIARNCGGGLIAGYVAANSFLTALEMFAGSAESHLEEFDESGEPFTLHDILEYTEAQLQSALRKTVLWVLVALLCVSALANAAVSLFSAAIFKKWLD